MWLKWGIDTVKTYRRNDPEILRTLIAQNEAFIHSRELKFANLSGIELFDFILKDFEERKNQDIANALRGLLPAKLIDPVLSRAKIQGSTKVHSIDKNSRVRLIDTLKSFEITADAFRPISEAIITSGGIKVSEIDPKTMESKKIPGLYFAGEIIDCDAYTGGFNLQIAWSTAYAAATAASGC